MGHVWTIERGMLEAALKEIKTLVSIDVWEVVNCEDRMNFIDLSWAFKLKHFFNGMVKEA